MDNEDRTPAKAPGDGWYPLRQHTPARIALGRSGGSQRTADHLAYTLDHALARDAVHAPFAIATVAQQLRECALEVVELETQADDRLAYLRRPELGRSLAPAARTRWIAANAPRPPGGPLEKRLVIIVSDGLSALAAERHAPRVLAEFVPAWLAAGGSLAPIALVRHARVGLLDEVGELAACPLALILLGERPGLGTADSLGAYFAFAPRRGQTDADRNCLSNIRPGGLSPEAAALHLVAWLSEAFRYRLSGYRLKEPAAARLEDDQRRGRGA